MAPPQKTDSNEAGSDASFVFGISGHRDLVPSTVPELRQSLETVFASFCAAYPGRRFELLSPLADGADRLTAEVALAHGMRLLVPMPMDQAEYERDFVTGDSLDEFRRLLAAADRHWTVVEDSKASEARPAPGDTRPRRYANMGDFIARKSHVLILLWDGDQNAKLGGTGWVKQRREHWIRVADKGGCELSAPGYLETIRIVTPRLASRGKGKEQPRVEIIGKLPAASG
jgi:hypothetical protein